MKKMSSRFKKILEEKNKPVERKTPDIEKYKFLFDYQKSVSDAERDRYFKLEDKGAKYLTYITIFITIYVFFIKYISDMANNNSAPLKIIFFLLVTATIYFGLRSWRFIFLSMRVNELRKMPFQQDTIDFFKKNKRDSIYLYLSKKHSEISETYNKVNLDKANFLKKAHHEIIVTGALFVVSVIIGLLWVCRPPVLITNQQSASLPLKLEQKMGKTSDNEDNEAVPVEILDGPKLQDSLEHFKPKVSEKEVNIYEQQQKTSTNTKKSSD